MSKRMILWTCLVCIGLVAVTYADSEDGDPVDFSIGIKAEFTDNRDSSEFDEEDNFDIFVTPRVDLFIGSASTVWVLFYAPSFRYRSDPSSTQTEDDLFHDLGINLDHEISQTTRIKVREHFEVTDDPSVGEGGFTIRDDRSFIRNDISAELTRDLSDVTQGDVGVDYELKRFDDSDVADESDEDEFGAHAKLWRKMNRTMGAQVLALARQYEFESASGIVRDFDIVTGAIGVEKVFSPTLRAGLDVGVSLVEYDDSGLDSETYPHLKINARLAPHPGLRIQGTVTHGVRDSDVFPFSTQEFTEFRGKVETDPSELVTIGAGLVFRQSEYDEDDLPATAPFAGAGDEDTLVGTAEGRWEISNTSRLVIRFTVEDVDSDISFTKTTSFTKNTGSVALYVDI